MSTKINSIFTVTTLHDGKNYEIEVSGSGQETVNHLRSKFPRFSKFVPTSLKTHNVIR